MNTDLIQKYQLSHFSMMVWPILHLIRFVNLAPELFGVVLSAMIITLLKPHRFLQLSLAMLCLPLKQLPEVRILSAVVC